MQEVPDLTEPKLVKTAKPLFQISTQSNGVAFDEIGTNPEMRRTQQARSPIQKARMANRAGNANQRYRDFEVEMRKIPQDLRNSMQHACDDTKPISAI